MARREFLKSWRRKRRSRKLSDLMKIGILCFGLVTTIFSGLTIISFTSYFYNLNIPDGNASINFNTTIPENMYLEVPYNITNRGYFDIRDITVNLSVDILYIENVTFQEVRRTIFPSKSYEFAVCRPNSALIDNMEGGTLDFDGSEIIAYNNEVEKSDPTYVLLNINILAYLYGIIPLSLNMENILIEVFY